MKIKNLSVAQIRWLADNDIAYRVTARGLEVFEARFYEACETPAGTYDLWETGGGFDPSWDLAPHELGESRSKVEAGLGRGEAVSRLTRRR